MNDNKQVSLFQFNKQQIRVVEIDGAPWFVSQDIPGLLGFTYDNMKYHSRQTLHSDERRVVKLPGFRGHGASMVSESGLYKLVGRSDKPEAKAFQDWVTREVLPSIRKNGGYIKDQEKVATGEMSGEELALRGYEALMKIYEDMKARAEKAEAQVDEHLKLMTVDEFRAFNHLYWERARRELPDWGFREPLRRSSGVIQCRHRTTQGTLTWRHEGKVAKDVANVKPN